MAPLRDEKTMTANPIANIDTRVLPVQWANATTQSRDAATRSDEGLMLALNDSAHQPARHTPDHRAAESASRTLSVEEVPERVQQRLSETVMSAQAAVGSLESRQRTYQSLERALQGGAANESRGGTEALITDLTMVLHAQRQRERAALVDSVQSANAIGLDVARRNDEVRSLTASGVGGTQLAQAVDQRDALVRSLGRLVGATATATADGGVDLSVGDQVLLHRQGWNALSVVGQLDGAGAVAIQVLGQPGAAPTTVPVASGVVGGQLEVVNDVLPHAMATLSAVSAGTAEVPEAELRLPPTPATGGAAGDPAASAVAPGTLKATLAEQMQDLVRGGNAALYLRVQGDGTAPVGTGGVVQRHLGAVSAGEHAAAASSVSALQQVNGQLGTMTAMAASVASAVAAGTQAAISISRPDLAGVSVQGVPAAGAVTFTVLSAARPASAISQQSFGEDEILNDGAGFQFGILKRVGDQERTTAVSVRDFPTIADVVSAINASGAGVRAMSSKGADGTVQLVVTSLETGRTLEVTVTNGQQPPSTSTILGRFEHLEGLDSVLKAERPGGSASVLSSATDTVGEVLPGVGITVRRPDPATSVTVQVERDPRVLADRTEALMHASAGVLGAVFHATQASGPLSGDRMLGELAGKVVSVLGPPGRGAVPGLDLSGAGRLTFDRAAFAAAHHGDPVATEAAVASLAQGLTELGRDAGQPRVGYLAMRLQAEQDILPDYQAPRAGADQRLARHQDDLLSRADALLSLLDRLTTQRSWLAESIPRG